MAKKRPQGPTGPVAARAPWPADRVERRPVAGLVPAARNARTHSAEQVAQLVASIREWGWTSPVLVDEAGQIIAGHGRVLAAQQLGLVDVPVMVAEGWTDAQKRAYVIADNKLALNAGWDDALLKLELGELQGIDFDLGLTGFSKLELGSLFARTEGLTDPDEAPPLPATIVTQSGDVWLLGKHRLVCGDATSAADVARALDGVAPHLMVTDPPYGVEYDPAWRNRVLRADGTRVAGRAVGVVNNDDRADWREAWALFPGAVAYVWHGGLQSVAVAESLVAARFDLRAQIIWAKHRFVIGRGDYHWQHEPCWYAVRKGKTGRWAGDRKQTTVWSIGAPSGWAQIHEGADAHQGIHSTQKPVECMRKPIENNSAEHDAVYDPFIGSGTTLIAAEMSARTCIGLEIDPAYCDVAVKRWEDFTGRKAAREAQTAAPELDAAVEGEAVG